MAVALVIFCRPKVPKCPGTPLNILQQANWEKNLKKYRYMFMRVTESLCYISDTNTFLSNYTPIQNKKLKKKEVPKCSIIFSLDHGTNYSRHTVALRG